MTGLVYLHTLKIGHRDIIEKNFFEFGSEQDGYEYKLADFGAVRGRSRRRCRPALPRRRPAAPPAEPRVWVDARVIVQQRRFHRRRSGFSSREMT